jgi:SOS response regulatory protein OraA/RecX
LSAYLDGLKMLGRRELSEQQVRQRLARKAHTRDEIDEAVARLRDERAINDQRPGARGLQISTET